MSYKLVTDPLMPAYEILTRDDKPVNCPFHAPIISNGKLAGQISMQYKGCGTWCALFHSIPESSEAQLMCSMGGSLLKITAEEPAEHGKSI